jgi:hypothetical protein
VVAGEEQRAADSGPELEVAAWADEVEVSDQLDDVAGAEQLPGFWAWCTRRPRSGTLALDSPAVHPVMRTLRRDDLRLPRLRVW